MRQLALLLQKQRADDELVRQEGALSLCTRHACCMLAALL
jgi:hypothetical protein